MYAHQRAKGLLTLKFWQGQDIATVAQQFYWKETLQNLLPIVTRLTPMLTHGKAGCAYKTTVWLPSNSTAARRLERLYSNFNYIIIYNFNLQSSLAERHAFHTALQVFKIFKSTKIRIQDLGVTFFCMYVLCVCNSSYVTGFDKTQLRRTKLR